jgi:two-component system sensor histidine kinase KdpD
MFHSRRELTMRRDWVRYLVHDLRGLIGVALSNVSFVADAAANGEDPDARDALSDSAQELKRAAALVNDLLDIERIESGRLRARKSATDATALVREVVQEMRSMAQRRGVGVVLDADGPATVPLDASLIERVVTNLVSNALRYAPRATTVFAEVERFPSHVRVSVTNLGPTIPTERRAQLFQPFVRVGPDAQQGTGAGLGLAFCRLAVEAHGGSIQIDEPPGGGATFTFTLPLGE